jgi:hypothetical protein
MARGWESKSVQSQMDAAENRRAAAQGIKQTAEELRLQREKESIELSKVRVIRDLQMARHPRHRAQLQAALAHLEQQLEKLSGSSSPLL